MSLYRVAVLGTHPAGDVISYGFHVMVGVIAEISSDAQSVADLVSSQIESQIANWTNVYPAGVRGSTVRVHQLNSTGTESVDVAESAIDGMTSTGSALPPQCAHVVTLIGGVGRSRTGRMYLPAPNATNLTTQGRVSSAVCTIVADVWQDIFQGINTGAITGTRVVVWSRTRSTSSEVTGIKVGDVVDTQRRRRNAVAETYTARTVSLA